MTMNTPTAMPALKIPSASSHPDSAIARQKDKKQARKRGTEASEPPPRSNATEACQPSSTSSAGDRFERLFQLVGGGRERPAGAHDDADAARQRFAADAQLMQAARGRHRLGQDADAEPGLRHPGDGWCRTSFRTRRC